jgi:hypothetical protein
MKGNATLMIETGIGLSFLIYWSVTQVLWGVLHSELISVIRTYVSSRVRHCSPAVRRSARNTPWASFSAALCVKEVYPVDPSARSANQRRVTKMGRAVLPCSPLLAPSRRTAPGSCLRGRTKLVHISAERSLIAMPEYITSVSCFK